MTSPEFLAFSPEERSKAVLVEHVRRGLLAADPARYAEAVGLVLTKRDGMLVLELGNRRMDVTCDSPLALLADVHEIMS